MSDYTYEKVEGITSLDLVGGYENGKEFYESCNGFFINIDVGDIAVKDLENIAVNTDIYTRKEKPWWEGMKGQPIMGMHDSCVWYQDILDKVCPDHNYPYVGYRCDYKKARPLTTAERDAIKVRD